jgi:hypothetical protein
MAFKEVNLKRKVISKSLLRKSKGWESVVEFYKWISKERSIWVPLFKLSQRLAKSPYAPYTFPMTSMQTLVIAQTEEFFWDRNVLKIDYDTNKKIFLFQYVETPYSKNQKHWTKQCAPREAYPGVVHFFQLQKWFTTDPKS